jgi:hypothetical protein
MYRLPHLLKRIFASLTLLTLLVAGAVPPSGSDNDDLIHIEPDPIVDLPILPEGLVLVKVVFQILRHAGVAAKNMACRRVRCGARGIAFPSPAVVTTAHFAAAWLA